MTGSDLKLESVGRVGMVCLPSFLHEYSDCFGARHVVCETSLCLYALLGGHAVRRFMWLLTRECGTSVYIAHFDKFPGREKATTAN